MFLNDSSHAKITHPLNPCLRQAGQNFLVGLLLFVVCFLTYSNSLHNEFMMDDDGLILTDTKIHNLKFLAEQFIPETQRASVTEGSLSNVYYRPLAHVPLAIEYFFFKDNPLGYHLVNLFLFYVVGLFIYTLIYLLSLNRPLSLLTTLFFCIHPFYSLIPNYKTAVVFAIQLLAMVGGIIAFIKSIRKPSISLWYYFLSIVCFLMALLCHESSFVFPLYLITFLWCVEKKSFKDSLWICAPYLLLTAVLFLLRLKFASLSDSLLVKIGLLPVTLGEYLASLTKLFIWYISKLILLKGVVVIWFTPPVKENVVLWLLYLMGMIISYLWLLNKFKKFPVAILALLWIPIGFSVVTLGCFFQYRNGFMIEPHWLFFSSIGFFILISQALLLLQEKLNKKLRIALLITILSVLMVNTRDLNRIWNQEKTYCLYWHREVPTFKSVIFYLAGAYMKQEEYKTARFYYVQALDQSEDWQIYNNLGLMDYQEGKLEEAKKHFKESLLLKPDSAVVYNNLGLVFFMQDNYESAAVNFEKAIYYNPFLLQSRINLTNIYKQKKKWVEVESLFRENLSIDPSDQPSLIGLIDILFVAGKKEEAVKIGKTILRESKKEVFLTQAGSLFALNRYNNLASALYTKALQINPRYASAYLELGKLYGNLEEFNQAIVVWQEGARTDPSDTRFKEHIEKAIDLQKQSVLPQ